MSIRLEKWQKTVELLAELYGAAAASIVELKGEHFEVVATSGGGANRLDAACVDFPLDLDTYCREIYETDARLYVPDGRSDPRWADAPPVKFDVVSYLGFPIHHPDNRFFGTICVKHFDGTDYSDVFVRALEQFRDLVEADLALAHQASQLDALASTDAATGCANRRGLRRYVDSSPSRGDKGVLYLDLDNLKKTNDRYGHDSGDEAIALLAAALKSQLRGNDIAARVGGDEFVCIADVPSASALDALRQRIVDTFTAEARSRPNLEYIGVSVGMSYFAASDEPLDLDTLLKGADERMYADKLARKQQRA